MKGPALVKRESKRLRQFYDKYAVDYDRWMDVYDRLLGDGRKTICSRARGKTLEVGIGTGLNLPFYPRDVQLTGIDLSSAMLALAGRRAQELGLEVELRIGDAQTLDFPDDCFDTVVVTLVLSSVPDCQQTAAELRRVLKPEGLLLLLDHVRSPFRGARWVERLLEPLHIRLTGFHLLRDPLDYLDLVGFRVERCERFKWGIVEEVVARKSQ